MNEITCCKFSKLAQEKYLSGGKLTQPRSARISTAPHDRETEHRRWLLSWDVSFRGQTYNLKRVRYQKVVISFKRF